MRKLTILTAALAASLASTPVLAQSLSVGVGVGFGEPGYYYGPPPVYYGPPPVYLGPPEGYLHEQPPIVVYPPPIVPSAVSPDEVFDNLERSGYRNFSPMAFRDGVYKLEAVTRRGAFVALEVSALTGQVEREYLIDGGAAEARPFAPAVPPNVPRRPVAGDRDPLVVY